jgi:hypothetical protein
MAIKLNDTWYPYCEIGSRRFMTSYQRRLWADFTIISFEASEMVLVDHLIVAITPCLLIDSSVGLEA